MPDTNFQPIFDYLGTRLQQQTDELRSEMATKKDIDKILTALDNLAKITKDHGDGILVIGNRLDRIEHWISKAAVKIEVPYKQ